LSHEVSEKIFNRTGEVARLIVHLHARMLR
jgi:hypothetical protein